MFKRRRPSRSFWAVCVAAILADVATKLLVVRNIPFGAYFGQDPERSPVVVWPWLWIVHVGNKGAAWGLGADHDVRPFLVFPALAVLARVCRRRHPQPPELVGGPLDLGLFGRGWLGTCRDPRFVYYAHVITDDLRA